MKKKTIIIALAAAFAAVTSRADVTNYVYTYETRHITNRVQNTHYNYYFTNNVTTITNIWNVNHTTNFHFEVVNTNFGPWLASASREANRAADGAVAATNMANVAAGHATRAGNYASEASSYASLAASYRNQAQTAANQGLASINGRITTFNAGVAGLEGRVEQLVAGGLDSINERISYFDEMYAGRTLTNETYVTATNIYIYYSEATNVVFNYNTVTNVTLTTNVYHSSSTVTNFVYDFTSVTNYTYNTTTNIIINQTHSTITNLNYSTVVSNTYILPGTGGGSIDLQTLSMSYVGTNGETYANIQYYPLGHANGKASATPSSNQLAARTILFAPQFKSPMTYPDDCFTYDIGYIDSDAGGMRIHYVSRHQARKTWTYKIGDLTLYLQLLPRDFYWQAGRYYAIVDVYRDNDGTLQIFGRFTYGAAASTYPNSVGATSADTGNYQSMSLVSHTGSLTPPSNGSYKTAQGGTVPGSAPLWIPAAPSAEQSAVIEWLNQFPVGY